MENVDIFSNDDRAYLAMLQANISRMATNSLYCKVLCGAFIPVLASSDRLNKCSFFICSLFLIITLLYLDSRYLLLEKIYIKKYDKYYQSILNNDFTVKKQIFNMNKSINLDFYNQLEVIKSWSIWIPYGAFFVCAIVASCSLS